MINFARFLIEVKISSDEYPFELALILNAFLVFMSKIVIVRTLRYKNENKVRSITLNS